MKKGVLIVLVLMISKLGKAQTDSAKALTFSGYAEAYYSYDFSNPSNHEKSNFLYNYKKHNEFNINLAYAKAAYAKDNVRANLALMIGNYAQYNLSAEPVENRHIYEANVGIKLSKQKNIWLDAGIMPSHIGFESAVGADCWSLTRSILAENSPYYETGIKLSFTNKNNKWNTAFLLLNGWQKINKPNDIQKPSFGMQVNYKPNNKLTLNYSNFIGTDKPDSVNAWRVFNNFYAIYEPNNKWGFTVGFDIGTDKYNNNNYGTWFSPVMITKCTINTASKIAARLEYYNDAKQIMIATNTANGFKVFGASLNYDKQINTEVLWRTEAKVYTAADDIFIENNLPSNKNISVTTSLSFKL